MVRQYVDTLELDLSMTGIALLSASTVMLLLMTALELVLRIGCLTTQVEVLHVGCEPGSTVTGQTCLNELYEQTTCTTTASVLRPSVPTDSARLQRPERRERLARSV